MTAALQIFVGVVVGINLAFVAGASFVALRTAQKLTRSGILFDAAADRWVAVPVNQPQAAKGDR